MTRDTYCFLATGAVAGWVWLRAKPWDAELFSLESISWGSLAGWASYRPYEWHSVNILLDAQS